MSTVELTVQLHYESASGRAVFVSDDGNMKNGKWLPKAQVEIVEEKGEGIAEIRIPERLAKEKGLI